MASEARQLSEAVSEPDQISISNLLIAEYQDAEVRKRLAESRSIRAYYCFSEVDSNDVRKESSLRPG